MARTFSFAIILTLLFTCCNQPANTPVNEVADTATQPVKHVPRKDSLIQEKQESADTNHTLFPGSDTLFANMHINGVKDKQILSIKILSGKILFAKLIPSEQQANLRINQLQMPDGSLDGPFGRDLDYKIKSAGNYKLIIGESLMAEGNWKGNFTVKVWVK